MAIIGIDFDGTLADTNTLKSLWIKERLGLTIPPYLCDHTSCITDVGRENYREMGDHVYGEQMTAAVQPVPGALAAVRKLRESHELVIVSARTGERAGFVERWLDKRPETTGIRVVGVKTSLVSKLQVCAEQGISALIDDDERHVCDASGSGVTAVLFKQDAPADFRRDHAIVCRTWSEVAEMLPSG